MGSLPPLLDTAASTSLITESIVWWSFPQPPIKAKAEELYGYGQDRIGTEGTINGASLIGLDRFRVLGFSITDNMCVTILTLLEAPLAVTCCQTGLPFRLQQPAPHRPAVPRSSSGLIVLGLYPSGGQEEGGWRTPLLGCEAVILDKYSPPPVDEPSLKLNDSVAFSKLDQSQA